MKKSKKQKTPQKENTPVKPNLDNVELTDDQLEEVAGGKGPVIDGTPPVAVAKI